MIPDRAALARYNTGVARSRNAYLAEQNGWTRCRRGHERRVGERCASCDLRTRHGKRKGEA